MVIKDSTFKTYVREFRENQDELRVLDIGNDELKFDLPWVLQMDKDLVSDRPVHYRGMCDPLPFTGCRSVPDYQTSTSKLLEDHVEDNNSDLLFVPWKVEDIPYPFPDGYFNEIHMHLITANFLYSKDDFFRKNYDVSRDVELDDWVDELARISTPDALLLTIIQKNYVFKNAHLPELGDALTQKGFGIQKIDHGLGFRFPEGDRTFMKFTGYPQYAGSVLLAQRGKQSPYPGYQMEEK